MLLCWREGDGVHRESLAAVSACLKPFAKWIVSRIPIVVQLVTIQHLLQPDLGSCEKQTRPGRKPSACIGIPKQHTRPRRCPSCRPKCGKHCVDTREAEMKYPYISPCQDLGAVRLHDFIVCRSARGRPVLLIKSSCGTHLCCMAKQHLVSAVGRGWRAWLLGNHHRGAQQQHRKHAHR